MLACNQHDPGHTLGISQAGAGLCQRTDVGRVAFLRVRPVIEEVVLIDTVIWGRRD
ncbi:MAG: hypothetical protein HOV86_02980 [Thermoactinospora sp.]|nr:hypothetical protein [Thermoactinospora sp.]